jgi:hypothetical protein
MRPTPVVALLRLAAPRAASAQTLRSFASFRDPLIVRKTDRFTRAQTGHVVVGKYLVFVDGNLKDVVDGN